MDLLTLLGEHDAWATRKLLNQCAVLSREQFHRPFEIGHGSLHANLTHIVGAMRRWADRIDARTVRPSIEQPPEARERSPLRLSELLEEALADLAGIRARMLAQGPAALDREIVFSFKGPTGEQSLHVTAGAAIVHLHTHGQHHRTQCLNMLRHLGYPSDSGDYDVIEWSLRRARKSAADL